MKKQFYSHIIEIESIYIHLDLVPLSEKQRNELMMIVDSTIHHTIMDITLSHLSPSDKKEFLSHMEGNNHEKTWQFITGKINRFEHKLHKAVQKIKNEIHADIERAKKM